MKVIFSRFCRLLLTAALVLTPTTAAFAQEVVAVLLTGDLPHYRQSHKAFMQVLENGGYGADKIKVFVQIPNPDTMSLANSVRRAIAAGAKIIITYGAPAATVASKESNGVQVLFTHVYDPVAIGLVKTMAAPGADISGVSSEVDFQPLLTAMQSIKTIQRLGILYTASEPGSAQQARVIEAAAGKLGIQVKKWDIPAPSLVDAALNDCLGQIDALFLTEGIPVYLKAAEIAEKAKIKGVPVFSPVSGTAEKGALLCHEADPEEQGKLVAVHTLQLFAGQKAHMLPVRQAKKLSLIVNRGAARRLSLSIPDSLLGKADRIID